jgi:hypothetical protein
MKENSTTKKEKMGYQRSNYSPEISNENIQSIKKQVSSWPEWKVQVYFSNERKSVKSQ